VRELIWYFLSIGGLAVAVLAATFWLHSRPHSAQARRFLFLVVIAYAVLSIHGIGAGVGRLLAININPLAALDVPPGRTAIVVLGSGGFTARDWTGGTYSIVDRVDATRMLEAVRVFRLVDAEWVISSDDPNEASGVTMRDAMLALGIPAARLIVETDSRSTRDEAMIVAPMLRNLDVEHLVLVTSGTHMRRSLGAFRAQGSRAIPAIARDPFCGDRVERLDPSERSGPVEKLLGRSRNHGPGLLLGARMVQAPLSGVPAEPSTCRTRTFRM
jgi:uncharacterized SAM-binding protein YcdF (DUF218 family)